MKISPLTLGFVLLAGCGGDNTGAVDSFIQSLAQQECDWEFRCCRDDEIARQDGHKFLPSDEASCVSYHALARADELYVDRLAAREGRLRVDPDRASACVQQMMNRVCNPGPKTPPPMIDPNAVDECAHVFVGNTPVGAECIYSNECVTGAHCVNDLLAVGRGVCVPYEHEGEICNDTTDCDPKVAELYCAKQDFKCHRRTKLGEACAYTTDAGGKNPMLPLLLECDNRLGNVYCDPGSNRCRQLPSDGESCLKPPPPGVSSSCDPDPALGLVCDTSGGGTSGTCRAPGKLGADCTQFPCAADFYCNSSGGSLTCAQLPSLGQDCQVSSERCAMPYYCNTQQSPYLCDQPAAVGESCVSRSCNTGLYCDQSGQRVCKNKLDDGSPCSSFQQCLSDSCDLPPTGGNQQVCRPAVTGLLCIGR